LQQEFPPPVADVAADGAARRLGTIQPDLIGEAAIIEAMRGEPKIELAARDVVARAYVLAGADAAQSLFRLLQDFAYALIDETATAEQKATAQRLLGWLDHLVAQAEHPLLLLPLVFALPEQTMILREPAARITQSLLEAIRGTAPPELVAALANNLATMLSDLGRREAALAVGEEAVRLRRALAEARPEAFTPHLARSLNNLATMLSALGRWEAALAAAEEAVRLRRALAEARPDAFTPDLAMSLNNLASRLSDLGRREAALAAAEEAAGLYRALADARPDAFTPHLAMSLNNLANRLSDLGRREAALLAAEEAVGLYRALADARPDAFTPNLATSLGALGRVHRAAEMTKAACDCFREGIEVLTPLLRASSEAFAGLIGALARDYLACCEDLRREPDIALLGPVVDILSTLNRDAQQ
jgi:tetratricopeptide (TPR) repeat protein